MNVIIFVMNIFIILLLTISSSLAKSQIDSSKYYKPLPFSNFNRIYSVGIVVNYSELLFIIYFLSVLAFKGDHIESLVSVLSEYVAICEAGWLPSVTVLTAMAV